MKGQKEFIYTFLTGEEEQELRKYNNKGLFNKEMKMSLVNTYR